MPVLGTSAAVDGRVLEDTSGRATLSGGSTDQIQASDVTVRWTGPGAAYLSGAGVPASRGATCTYTHAGTLVPQPASACGLTDGDLSTPVAIPPVCAAGVAAGSTAPPPCPSADAVVLYATAPSVFAELVVVRGCRATCAVAVTEDGHTFRSVGSVTGPFGLVAVDKTPVKAVRVSNPDGLREVSVWGAAKAPALAPVTTKDAHDLRSPFVASHGARHRGLLLGVAAVLLALVLLGLGFALGRRRS
jgi:hypothetical protein